MIDVASKISAQNYVTDPEVLRQDLSLRDRVAAMRVLADHCRSTSFLIADGAQPSNDGRGYVLRRIMRRAIRYGRKLSMDKSFLLPMSEALIQNMSSFYPELSSRKDLILSTIKDEENRFLQTLDHGTSIFQDEIKKIKLTHQKIISGETVFKLYDTYGFPVDLTALMAAEQNLTVDEVGFEKIMQASKEKAKSSWKSKSIQSDAKHMIEFGQKYSNTPTQFVGYELLSQTAKVVALSNGASEVNTLNSGDQGLLILDQTPFYAEGGGQVGDQGVIEFSNGLAKVLDVTKQGHTFLHHIDMIKGDLKIQTSVVAKVESKERRQTASNHSATHLMHSALRHVLGTHVTQAGSLVDSAKTRFDFTHNKPLTTDEIKKIEDLVNNEISKAHPVKAEILPHQIALEKGAMALFGEKYGSEVRVLTMGGENSESSEKPFSCELCGGTHVNNTAQIRVFKIISESGVSSGVRRIEAMTGDNAVDYLLKNTEELKSAKFATGLTNDKSLTEWIESKKEEIKDLNKQIKKAQSDQINIDDFVKTSKSFLTKSGPAQYVFANLNIDDRDVLSQIADQLKNKIQKGIVIIVGTGDVAHPVVITVTKDISTEYSAGNLLKDFAQILGGKGGGRPDFAQGAVPDRSKINDANLFIHQKLAIK